jgi:hypothetical protein
MCGPLPQRAVLALVLVFALHTSIACLLYEDSGFKFVWVSLGNAMKAKQSKAKRHA